MTIELAGISKAWGEVPAVHDVSLTVKQGELLALLGPSGSGKTTLLRIIAGLETPDAGTVVFDGKDASTAGVRERGVGFVFQHYALFRHMTVFDNVAFGLNVLPRHERKSAPDVRRRVLDLLRLVQLEAYADRLPAQLSGGQRQRVALARALAIEPKVLLLDEPFGALDAKVRAELRRWLRTLHDELHVTSVLVTHDQEEALEVADRVVVMNQGRVEQVGAPAAVVDEPANAFVHEFVGEVNALPAYVKDGDAVSGRIRVPAPGFAEGASVRILVRTYDVGLQPADGEMLDRDDPQGIAEVERVSALGDRVKVTVRLDGGPSLVAQLSRARLAGIRPGSRVDVALHATRLYG